jgi:FkbH-like protein
MSNEKLLPDTALQRIDNLIAALDHADEVGFDYSDVATVHFLRNFTIEPIEPYLKFHIIRDALQPDITFGGYDSALQEILGDDSALRGGDGSADIIVVALDLSALDTAFGEPGWSADQAIERTQQVFDAIREHTPAIAVVNTLLPVLPSDSGGAMPAEAIVDEVRRANTWINDYANAWRGRFAVIDWCEIMDDTGLDDSIDARFWRTSMAPFRAPFLDRYSRQIARVVRALKGKAKKCLILDCDDTLWGGVIGEDGLDGIHLGEAEGADFAAFQRSVIELQRRGVLLALCSKNNPEDVWEVLDQHPHCVLQRSHLAAWRINWDDKASNIIALGDELNLPLDSFVFVDDSPRECQLIRDLLPEVTVLQVPEKLEGFAELVVRDGLFDTLNVSDEDRHRSRHYQEQQVRAQSRSSHTTVDEYLASLDQVLRIWCAEPDDLARITQLTQKTNQFNLTTRRYSEGQISAFMDGKDTVVYAMSVTDRYGDLGITGVLIARRDGDAAIVDTLLLSCRVLGRKFENAFVDRCLAQVEQEWGVSEWRAEFLPTKKNSQVAEFWDRVGFSVLSATDSITAYSRAAGRRHNNYSDVMSIEEA